jgi:hypothetical protein
MGGTMELGQLGAELELLLDDVSTFTHQPLTYSPGKRVLSASFNCCAEINPEVD